ncbi:hypothetical protein [Nonomuraea sp. NPDC049709]|uniref:hypothetical protein n=1 Tax=Nonomuraea sp. NPDC049709 TaxID=3154736 RepID=UPI003426A5A5
MPQGAVAQHGPRGHRAPPQAWSSRENLGLIVLLAVGLPLILLGGGAAVVMVLTDTGQGTVATEAGAPNMIMPSREPVPNQQQAEGVASEPPGGLAGQPTGAAGQPTGAGGQPTSPAGQPTGTAGQPTLGQPAAGGVTSGPTSGFGEPGPGGLAGQPTSVGGYPASGQPTSAAGQPTDAAG